MSELTDLFKKIEDVDTSNYLNQYHLKRFAFTNSLSGNSQLYLDDSVQNKNLKLIIGWCGDAKSEEGAGPTRPVQDAEYRLHLFAVKNEAKLTKPTIYPLSFNTPSQDVQTLEKYLKQDQQRHIPYTNADNDDIPIYAHYPKIPDSIPNSIPNFEKINHIVYAKADIVSRINPPKDASENTPTRFFIATGEEILTNVYKKGLSNHGNIILHLSVPSVLGSNYIEQKDFDSKEPLRTYAVLFSKSLGGSKFRNKIFDSMKSMSDFAGQSGISYDSMDWLLLVNNSIIAGNDNNNYR